MIAGLHLDAGEVDEEPLDVAIDARGDRARARDSLYCTLPTARISRVSLRRSTGTVSTLRHRAGVLGKREHRLARRHRRSSSRARLRARAASSRSGTCPASAAAPAGASSRSRLRLPVALRLASPAESWKKNLRGQHDQRREIASTMPMRRKSSSGVWSWSWSGCRDSDVAACAAAGSSAADLFREHGEPSVAQTRSGVLEHEAEELRADTQRDLRRLGQVEITLLPRS